MTEHRNPFASTPSALRLLKAAAAEAQRWRDNPGKIEELNWIVNNYPRSPGRFDWPTNEALYNVFHRHGFGMLASNHLTAEYTHAGNLSHPLGAQTRGWLNEIRDERVFFRLEDRLYDLGLVALDAPEGSSE